MAGSRKPPELSAGLLAVKGAAAPAADMSPRTADPSSPPAPRPDPPPPEDVDRNDAPLNFRVSPAFRREFKTYAAQNDLKLNELLRLAFNAYVGKKDG